jgi:hypothetical protein
MNTKGTSRGTRVRVPTCSLLVEVPRYTYLERVGAIVQHTLRGHFVNAMKWSVCEQEVAAAALQSKPPPPPTTCTALTMTFIQLLLLTAQVHIVQLARHTKGSLFTAPYASFERRPRGSLRKSSVAFLACIESKLSIKRDLVQALLQCGHCHAFIDCANSMAIRHATTTTTRRLDDSRHLAIALIYLTLIFRILAQTVKARAESKDSTRRPHKVRAAERRVSIAPVGVGAEFLRICPAVPPRSQLPPSSRALARE